MTRPRLEVAEVHARVEVDQPVGRGLRVEHLHRTGGAGGDADVAGEHGGIVVEHVTRTGALGDHAEVDQAKLLELVMSRIPERFGLDPVNDVQVLTPMNRGRMGTLSLNGLLQAHLNPDPPLVLRRDQGTLALGDKVMQLENDHDREVYNGDVGRITAIDPRAQTVEVTIDGRRLSYGGDELDQLAVAYAVTVHKAQGSEYAAVIVPLLRQHGRMLRRNLLYTAITRARRPRCGAWYGPAGASAWPTGRRLD